MLGHKTVSKQSHKTPKTSSTKRRALGDISNRTTAATSGGKAILLQKNGSALSKKGLGVSVSTKKKISRNSKPVPSQGARKSVSFNLFEDKSSTSVKRPSLRNKNGSGLSIHLDDSIKESTDTHDEVDDIEVMAGRSYVEEQELLFNEPIRSIDIHESITLPALEKEYRKECEARKEKMLKKIAEERRIADAKLEETFRQIEINDAEALISPSSILEADCIEEVNFDDDSSDEFFSNIISGFDDSAFAI